jgi:hypothetical protein
MSIARISAVRPDKVKVTDMETSVVELKTILKSIKGSKILMVEESSPAQWLYIELHDAVERIVICDPYRNRLLSDGPKNDPIDARKLCQLLFTGMVHEVYHSTEQIYELRKYVSAYMDLVKMGVRLKNQHAGFLAQVGKSKTEKAVDGDPASKFILGGIEALLVNYESGRAEFVKLFAKLCKEDERLKYLRSIPGIAAISAVKILAIIIDPKRFKTTGKYLVYCGLAKHIASSGGRVYGIRTPRYNRILKSVYRTAAVIAISGNNPMHEYYDYLLSKGMEDFNARQQVARYIAKLSLGILKKPEAYQPYRWRSHSEIKDQNLEG